MRIWWRRRGFDGLMWYATCRLGESEAHVILPHPGPLVGSRYFHSLLPAGEGEMECGC